MRVTRGMKANRGLQQLNRGQTSGGPVPCGRASRLVLVSEGQVERTDG